MTGPIRFSTACSLCIASGYIYCALVSGSPSLDSSNLWWQEKEDGSQHDRRSEEGYLELLDWDSQAFHPNSDVRRGSSWKEWKERLGVASVDWKKMPKGIERRRYCSRHPHFEYERINRYTLESKLYFIRVYPSQISYRYRRIYLNAVINNGDNRINQCKAKF